MGDRAAHHAGQLVTAVTTPNPLWRVAECGDPRPCSLHGTLAPGQVAPLRSDVREQITAKLDADGSRYTVEDVVRQYADHIAAANDAAPVPFEMWLAHSGWMDE
jgi:hypothetical protein